VDIKGRGRQDITKKETAYENPAVPYIRYAMENKKDWKRQEWGRE
jgi:hypothetical protein